MTSPVKISTLPPHLLGWQNTVSSQLGTGLAPPALPFPPRTQNDQDPDASAGAQEQTYHGGFLGGFVKSSLPAEVFNYPRLLSSSAPYFVFVLLSQDEELMDRHTSVCVANVVCISSYQPDVFAPVPFSPTQPKRESEPG